MRSEKIKSLHWFCFKTQPQCLFPTQFYPSSVIYIDNFNQNFVTLIEDICNIFDPFWRQLGDVDESINTRKDFDKGSKVRDFFYLSHIQLSHFHLLTYFFDQ